MTDYHVHTTYCDGVSGAEDIVVSAIKKGVRILGFSGHSFNVYDGTYCMDRDTTAYREEISALRERYKDKITILCGIERDKTTKELDAEFDFVIGSVHHVVVNGEDIPVDNTPELLKDGIDRLLGGDIYAFCERYYDDVAILAEEIRPDIIGHFDLITKFAEKGFPIDGENPRYVAAYTKAIERIVPLGIPFEINTGAISRGYRTTPYPSLSIMKKISEMGGKFILTSDSHAANTICFEFLKWRKTAGELGLTVLDELSLRKN